MSERTRLAGDSIDFEVLKETWCKCQVSDGTKIKMRDVLLDVRRTMAGGLPKYSINMETLTTVMCEPKLRGEPSDQIPTGEELFSAIEQRDMQYDTISADQSSYILDDGTKIKVNTDLVDVSRTTIYNQLGDRVYIINRNPSIYTSLAPQYGAKSSP